MPETFESLLVKLARARVEYLVAGNKDQLDVATLRRIIAGETHPGVADLTRLTPPESFP
jgi:hypothetical protein